MTSPVGIVNQFFPDMFVGIRYLQSDDLKSLAYHEIAHTSHYMLVGPDYWSKLVAAEVAADGHGNQFSNDAGRIAICESWAEYLGGHHYVHRTYGATNSVPRDWEINLERTWNETVNHITVGLHHDLVDEGEPTFFNSQSSSVVSACNQDELDICTIVEDQVSEFTNAQIFQSIPRQVTNIEQFRQRLITTQLSNTANSVNQINALFDSY